MYDCAVHQMRCTKISGRTCCLIDPAPSLAVATHHAKGVGGKDGTTVMKACGPLLCAEVTHRAGCGAEQGSWSSIHSAVHRSLTRADPSGCPTVGFSEGLHPKPIMQRRSTMRGITQLEYSAIVHRVSNTVCSSITPHSLPRSYKAWPVLPAFDKGSPL